MSSRTELDRYMERVRAIPLLSREEEHDLAVLSRAGDKKSSDKLVESNLRFVLAVALKYRRYGIPVSDLVAEGNMGLMMAVRKFDPDRGTRFVTYAAYWIRAYILDLVVRSTTMVGAGSGPLRSKLYFRLRRERAKVASLVTDPAERLRLMAERFDMSVEKMEKMLRRLDSRDVSLDAPVFDDAGVSLVDTLESNVEAQDARMSNLQRKMLLQESLGRALEELDRRERMIVERRYLGDESISLAALGRELGVSRERARQLEVRAKNKLRKRLRHLQPMAA